MTQEKSKSLKPFGIELLRTVSTVVVAGIIMGFIMKPEVNKESINSIKEKASVNEEKHKTLEITLSDHTDRIKRLENMLPFVATKEDLQILKQDLVRELKR